MDQKTLALQILARLSAYDALVDTIANNLMIPSTIQQFMSNPKFKGEGMKSREARLYQEIFSNLAKHEKWMKVLLEGGYVSYVAEMLQYPDLNVRHLAIETLAPFVNDFRGRIVVSETDIFPTLLQYVYGDDPFGTFKKKSAKTDEDVEENEKKFMLKNLAKFILHNLYISVSAASHLLERNPNLEENITTEIHDDLSSFNLGVEILQYQSLKLMFNMGMTTMCGLVWGGLRALEIHRPTTNTLSTVFRKGSLPALSGGLALLFFAKVLIFFHNSVVKTGEPAFYFLFDCISVLGTTMILCGLIGLSVTPFCLVPAFSGLSELHPYARRPIRSIVNKVLHKDKKKPDTSVREQ